MLMVLLFIKNLCIHTHEVWSVYKLKFIVSITFLCHSRTWSGNVDGIIHRSAHLKEVADYVQVATTNKSYNKFRGREPGRLPNFMIAVNLDCIIDFNGRSDVVGTWFRNLFES